MYFDIHLEYHPIPNLVLYAVKFADAILIYAEIQSLLLEMDVNS